ncbi:MAG: hypothetical protein IJZ42_11105 [Lachnospiraceae bacterium]|nr:hypothetical protein [Lachnospiraceae bacterium]
MKKFFTLLISIAVITGLIACNSEPDHELWQQYKATDNPSALFTDISTQEAVILDNDDYTITLYELSNEDIRSQNDKYDGFLFGVKIENKTSTDSIFTFTDIKVNGIALPEPEKVPFSGMAEAESAYMYGLIYIDYEGLARCNITTVEEVSFVMEVNEMIDEIKEETNENGSTSNVHYLEKGKLLYTSDEITFKCITE